MSDHELLDIEEYLQNTGTVGIIVRLGEDGLLNKELEAQIHVSQTTLAKRLKRGKELDLLAETRKPSDHGNAKRYVLTERGEAVQKKIEELGLDTTYKQLFEAYQELSAADDELAAWIEDTRIADPRWPPNTNHPDEPDLF